MHLITNWKALALVFLKIRYLFTVLNDPTVFLQIFLKKLGSFHKFPMFSREIMIGV